MSSQLTTAVVANACSPHGCALVKSLSESGFHVRALTQSATSPEANNLRCLKNVTVVEGDKGQLQSVAQAFEGSQVVFANSVGGVGATEHVGKAAHSVQSGNGNCVPLVAFVGAHGACACIGHPHERIIVQQTFQQREVIPVVLSAATYAVSTVGRNPFGACTDPAQLAVPRWVGYEVAQICPISTVQVLGAPSCGSVAIRAHL